MEEELEVRSLASSVVRRWYLVVFFGLLGALAGYGLSLLNPPIYRTQAIFGIGLNFDLTTPLSQYEEDFALGKVARVVVSDEVIEKALSTLSEREGQAYSNLTLGDFRRSITLEQKGSRWELIAFGENPRWIAAIANSWAEAAEESLWEAYRHTLGVDSLRQQLGAMNKELGSLKAQGVSDTQDASQIKDLERLISEMEAQIQTEIELARGLTTFVSFEWTEKAMVPEHPATRSRAGQILAGNFLGMVAGSLAAILIASVRKSSFTRNPIRPNGNMA